MIRGANAQFKFKLPYNYSELETVKITFWQDENNGPALNRPLPIVKILAQCSPTQDPKELTITLNQEETLRFSEERKGWTQLRGVTIDGIPIASKKRDFTSEWQDRTEAVKKDVPHLDKMKTASGSAGDPPMDFPEYCYKFMSVGCPRFLKEEYQSYLFVRAV